MAFPRTDEVMKFIEMVLENYPDFTCEAMLELPWFLHLQNMKGCLKYMMETFLLEGMRRFDYPKKSKTCLITTIKTAPSMIILVVEINISLSISLLTIFFSILFSSS